MRGRRWLQLFKIVKKRITNGRKDVWRKIDEKEKRMVEEKERKKKGNGKKKYSNFFYLMFIKMKREVVNL